MLTVGCVCVFVYPPLFVVFLLYGNSFCSRHTGTVLAPGNVFTQSTVICEPLIYVNTIVEKHISVDYLTLLYSTRDDLLMNYFFYSCILPFDC